MGVGVVGNKGIQHFCYGRAISLSFIPSSLFSQNYACIIVCIIKKTTGIREKYEIKGSHWGGCRVARYGTDNVTE